MSIRVRLEHGQGAGTTWRLATPGVYGLGRVPQSSIQVLDMRVSKEHAEIHLADDGVRAKLKDLGSTHGCQVNGQPVVGEAALKAGDELRMGNSILRILSDGNADKEAAPVQGRTQDAAKERAPAAAETHRTLPPDDLVGRELAGYRVERKIGAGGMGGVYVAEQMSLHRKVALKVLSERFASDKDFVDQFVNEARAAGALNHPNVVQVYDVGSAEGHQFFSMEVMPGGSIEDRIKDGPAEWSEALNWFLDAANALIFARKKGILHRDVKPDNLMLAEDGSAKLCDLGLAKKSEHGDLMDQGIIGTPHFISPEAIRRRPDIDHRTDLYSLGCTFYRVLTGKNPYPGATVKEILLGHLNKPTPRVSATNPDVPRELDDVIHQLMEKDAGKRYATPEDLLQALDKVRLQHGLEAHGLKPSGKKPLILAGIAVLVALGVGIAFAMQEPEVVVQKKTPEQLAAEKASAVNGARGRAQQATADIPASVGDFLKRENDPDVPLRGSGDMWKDPKWNQLIEDYRAKGAEWAAQAEDFRADAKKAELPEIAAIYEDAAVALDKAASDAKRGGDEVERYIQRRRDKAAAISEARDAARTELARIMDAHKAKVDAAAGPDGDPVQLALLLRGEVIETLAKDLLDQKFEGEFELLDAREVQKASSERFGTRAPSEEFYGMDRLKKVVAALNQEERDLENEIERLLGDTLTPEGLTQAIERLTTFLDGRPASPDEQAGTIANTLARQHADATRRRKALVTQRETVVAAVFRADREAYFLLLQALFRPASARGMLATFDIASAKVAATNFLRGTKTAEYRALGEHWVRAVDGLSAAMDRMTTTFPDGWTSDKVPVIDERGREDTARIKEIDRTSVVRDKDRVTLSSLGPAWVLKNLFRDGGAPRFALQGLEHLGLATLAEVAGDYDTALSAYRACMAADGATAPEVVAGIEARLGALDREKRAAQRWQQAVSQLAEVRATLDRHDPAIIGADAFDGPRRESLFTAERDLRAALQAAANLLTQLREDPELASTAWLAGVSEALPPGAAYAGEKLPAAGAPPPGDGGPGNGAPGGSPGNGAGGG